MLPDKDRLRRGTNPSPTPGSGGQATRTTPSGRPHPPALPPPAPRGPMGPMHLGTLGPLRPPAALIRGAPAVHGVCLPPATHDPLRCVPYPGGPAPSVLPLPSRARRIPFPLHWRPLPALGSPVLVCGGGGGRAQTEPPPPPYFRGAHLTDPPPKFSGG